MSKLVIGVSQCLLETCVYCEHCRAGSRGRLRALTQGLDLGTERQGSSIDILYIYIYIYIFHMYTQIVFSLESIKKLINLQSIKNTYST